jgi:hypothetical protein
MLLRDKQDHEGDWKCYIEEFTLEIAKMRMCE